MLAPSSKFPAAYTKYCKSLSPSTDGQQMAREP